MNTNKVFILTNSEDTTSDYLCMRLEEHDLPFCRFNTDIDCCTSLFSYKPESLNLKWAFDSIQPEQIKTVILRRPKPINIEKIEDEYAEMHTAGEWSESIEGFLAHIEEEYWINHPARNSCASHKIEQLSRAKKYGLMIPRTIVTNNIEEAKNFIHSEPNGIIVKPLASGYIERDHLDNDTIIYTNLFKEEHHILLEKISTCPILFQSQIEKIFDVRVTVIDNTLVGMGLKNNIEQLDIRRDNMDNVEYFPIDIPMKISIAIRNLLRSYKLRFAALDFGVTELGEWYFFEINPNGQWAWLDIFGGANISDAFINTLKQ